VATFLFDQIIFGPVHSRRLGVSLGINLLPTDRKICNFDCIYCECGLNPTKGEKTKLPTRQEVFENLKNKLTDLRDKKSLPDVITFAGNGEPTIHPEFAGIIDDTVELRNKICPSAAISVLSNATMLHKPEIIEALKKVDQNILKLDSGLEQTINIFNRPNKKIPIEILIDQLAQFKGRLIIQSMFTRGEINGKMVDNTQEEDLEAWITCIAKIRPEMVMIYTIERDTPFDGLKKVPLTELNQIAAKISDLGIITQISG
jgi:wyosine [tRNA(Phe)-imidazoG37] synthetase (radical SAM superfamily)